MLKLIQLELRRNRLSAYWIAALSITLTLVGMGLLFLFLPLIMETTGEYVPYSEKMMMGSWNGMIPLLSTLAMVAFSILSAAMHARYVISDYSGKRLLLLFSYPLPRKKILWAKCCLVFVFTVVMLIICNLAATCLLGLLSNIFHIIPETFGPDQILHLLLSSLVLSLLAGAVGMIAMRIGFWKKSVTVAIVSSVVLCCPFSNLFAASAGGGIPLMTAVMIVLLAASLVVFCSLLQKVNRMEAL